MQQCYLTVQFGPAFAGCATVGYTLMGGDGASVGERMISGIVELPAQSGLFGAAVSLPDSFIGSVVWDTGGAAPVYAIEEVNAAAAGGSGGSQDPRIMSGGSGSVLWKYQILNQSGQPIIRADVYASIDPEGRRVVAFARTDAEGMARLSLDPGPVYLWRSRPGCVFVNPELKTVEAE
jgi:hypothetical protein